MLAIASWVVRAHGGRIALEKLVAIRGWIKTEEGEQIAVPGDDATRTLPRAELHFEYRALRGLPPEEVVEPERAEAEEGEAGQSP